METLPYNNAHINFWYITYKSGLVDIGLRFGLTGEEINDIINQFFLDLLEKQIDPDSINNPQAFIITSFKRRLIDYSRSRKRRTSLHNHVSVDNEFEPCISDTLDKIQSDIELRNKIREKYEKLPARCKRVIYLKFYEGKTTEEIVENTGLSKRTVYNNLFEGIKMLRKELVNKPELPETVFLSALSLLFLYIFKFS